MLLLGLRFGVGAAEDSNLLAILRTAPVSSRTRKGAGGASAAEDELVVSEDLDSPVTEAATPGTATADLPPPKVMWELSSLGTEEFIAQSKENTADNLSFGDSNGKSQQT